MRHAQVLETVSKIIPALTSTLYKGSSGRVAIVGGSYEYCGAPYYAAISSLRVGADLSFIFCTKHAAIPIKTYSPEFMVLPCLDSAEELEKGLDRLDGIHSVVVGPGLGRDKTVLQSAETLIRAAKQKNKPIILDGDALFLISTNSSLLNHLKGYSKLILTPNKMEFIRLYNAVFGRDPVVSNSSVEEVFLAKKETDEAAKDLTHPASSAINLARELGNVAILKKGKEDIITDGSMVLVNSEFGSNRRCGGQGDVLAGSTGVFVSWVEMTEKISLESEQLNGINRILLAGFAASSLVRKSNEEAFKRKKRSMVTPDLIEELGASFEFFFSSL